MDKQSKQKQFIPQRCKYHKEAQTSEEQLIEHYELKIGKDIHVYDVQFENQYGFQWIHTYASGFQHEKTIVMTHGYGGSSITMLQVLRELRKEYRVFCIDLPGMGLSSRQPFNIQNPEEVIDYFVESINEWRKSMNIQSFILAGHSFGGYISGMYFKKYHEFVEKLILISPLGMRAGTEEENLDTDKQNLETMPFTRKIFYNQVRGYIKQRKSFSQIFQGILFPSSIMLNRYLSNRLQLPDDQKQHYKEYLENMLYQQHSSETALYQLFLFPTLIAQIPLGKTIEEMNSQKPVLFYYGGAGDWMRQVQAQQMVLDQSINGEIVYVPDSGHQLPIENPKGLAQLIIENIKIYLKE